MIASRMRKKNMQGLARKYGSMIDRSEKSLKNVDIFYDVLLSDLTIRFCYIYPSARRHVRANVSVFFTNLAILLHAQITNCIANSYT